MFFNLFTINLASEMLFLACLNLWPVWVDPINGTQWTLAAPIIDIPFGPLAKINKTILGMNYIYSYLFTSSETIDTDENQLCYHF